MRKDEAVKRVEKLEKKKIDPSLLSPEGREIMKLLEEYEDIVKNQPENYVEDEEALEVMLKELLDEWHKKGPKARTSQGWVIPQ
jgi:DNA-binding transcriptional ArsR family regulator